MIIEISQFCTSCLLVLWAFAGITTALFPPSNKNSPFFPGDKVFSKESFPEPSFDETAPICTFDKEPCGFYSFTTNGHMSFKWVKSWCRCGEDQECAFDRMDMRMRVFRHTCMPTNRTFRGPKSNIDSISKRRHRHRRHHHSHLVSKNL